MRGDRLARQWKIIQLLTHSRSGLSVAEIAQQLDEPVRSIYRDLEALQKAGFPFYTSREGRHSRWRVMEGYELKMAVPFTLEELKVLEVARYLVRSLSKGSLSGLMDTLTGKIHAALPPGLAEKLAKFQEKFCDSVLQKRIGTDLNRAAKKAKLSRRLLNSRR
jgi:predicted DNA-binding transcriptional regulator YafY